MKFQLLVIVFQWLLFAGVLGTDFSAGIAKIRKLLCIADNIELVPIAFASGSTSYGEGYGEVAVNTVIRFELRGNSLPVYDAIVTAEFFPNGSYANLWTSNGAKVKVRDNGVPRISSRRALYILAQKFDLCRQLNYLQHKSFSLSYLVDPNTNAGRLIYHGSFVYYGHVTSFGNKTTEPIRPTGLIDANTGEVIESWNGINSQSSTRTILAYGGNTGNAGKITYPQLMVGVEDDGQCVYKTPEVQVQNMKSRTIDSFSPTRFVCNAPSNELYDNVNSGYSPLNDAMSNAQTTVRMFREYVNRINSAHFDLPLKLRVHYGVNYDQAFWDGTYANFGDGSPEGFYPLVTLESIAHEIAHSFTSVGSRLGNLFEPSGINEAFSDMAGQAAVFYSGRTPTLKPGIEFRKNKQFLRDMCNPAADGSSIDHYSKYTNRIDAHYSSGIYNKAFCILSQNGGSWNVGTAFGVFAYANRMSWRPKTTFNSGVCGVKNAARVLLGESAVNDVDVAFQQVGLSCNK